MKIPYAFAKSQGVLLIETLNDDGVQAQIILRENANIDSIAEIQRHLNNTAKWKFVSNEEFEKKLIQNYNQEENVARVFDDRMGELDLSKLAEEIPQTEDLMDASNDAPIIKMINGVLTQGIRENASDIHLEPYEKSLVVRFRIDGTLREVVNAPRAIHSSLVSRIKIMSGLDIAEKRLPQDGRISLKLLDQAVDVRVSTLPTGRGERVVLRLLRKEQANINLLKLGMENDTLNRFDNLVQNPHGIILVTGPTGSGKTTTLYAGLSRLDSSTINIMTVEDPIEYELPGVGQTQVNPRIDMTFARALRSILRQDPDVVMIGEIRDLETAEIAVQASLTGHLVLATLHTNDAVAAINRLIDMGVESFLLASSVIGVLAQRLVRKLCINCREKYVPDNSELEILGITTSHRITDIIDNKSKTYLYRPKGCEHCGNTGYSGRVGIFQLLEMDSEMQVIIHQRGSEAQLREVSYKRGMRTLRADAIRWLQTGITSVEEVLRVTAN